MSVRLRKWKDKQSGKQCEAWVTDVQFQHADGRVERIRKVSPINTRRGAEQYERDLRLALAQGRYGKEVVAEQVPTVEQFAECFLTYSKNNNKPSTVHAKNGLLRNHLMPAFGHMRLNEIGTAEVEKYKAEKLRGNYAPKAINNQLTALRKLLNLAVEYKKLEHAPKVRPLKLTERPFQFLAFEEVERFLEAASHQWRPLLIIALNSGLRVGELLALRWEDCDLLAGKLIVRRSLWNGIEGSPKGGRTREVPLNKRALRTLKALRHLRGPYVFCKEDGTRLSHSEVKNILPRVCERAGLPKRLTMHGLRHTFASHLVMRRVPLKAVQELLGHATIDMTLRYAHLSPDVKREAVLALETHPHGTYAAHSAASVGKNS
jgi:integrase